TMCLWLIEKLKKKRKIEKSKDFSFFIKKSMTIMPWISLIILDFRKLFFCSNFNFFFNTFWYHNNFCFLIFSTIGYIDTFIKIFMVYLIYKLLIFISSFPI